MDWAKAWRTAAVSWRSVAKTGAWALYVRQRAAMERLQHQARDAYSQLRIESGLREDVEHQLEEFVDRLLYAVNTGSPAAFDRVVETARELHSRSQRAKISKRD